MIKISKESEERFALLDRLGEITLEVNQLKIHKQFSYDTNTTLRIQAEITALEQEYSCIRDYLDSNPVLIADIARYILPIVNRRLMNNVAVG